MVRPASHPGEILADELQELEMSAAELSRTLQVPTNRITQILNGQRGITADTALRLGQWLGTGAELWLNLQKSYELRLAEQETGEEIKKIKRYSSASGQQAIKVCSYTGSFCGRRNLWGYPLQADLAYI